jgi:hypothetical protein
VLSYGLPEERILQELIRETKRVTPAPTDAALERDLSRLSVRAGLALWWELLWPALVPLLGVGALFVAASWIGLFASLPHWARLGGLALAAAALLVALMPLARIVPPGRAERLRRVDRDSEARHGLASAWADRLGAGAQDGATRTLWQAHRDRLREELVGARVAWPRPGMVARDRRALRVAPLLILAAAFFAAGPNRLEKIAAALDPQASPAPAVEARIDGWIDPPAYARMPPLVIDFAKSQGGTLELRAPVGSTLVLRWPEGAGVRVQPSEGLEPQGQATVSAGVSETRWRLKADGSVTITGGPREQRLSPPS